MPASEQNVILHCARCPLDINSAVGQFVVCGGPCEKIFHVTCANVQLNQLQSFSSNVLWFCDRCLSAFRDWKKRLEIAKSDSVAVSRDIDMLKNQVTEIAAAVGSLSSIVSSNSSSSTVMRHSTPIVASTVSTRTAAEDGTKVNFNCSSSMRKLDEMDDSCSQSKQAIDDGNIVSEEISDQRCQLFLSNIDTGVTERDIELMVCKCLNAPIEDCRNVRKLVPKWLQGCTLDYISFKVELDRKWKQKAMLASTWPSGLKFRQFVNRHSTPWKPTVQ